MGTIWGMVMLATLGGFDSDIDNEQSVVDGSGVTVIEQVSGNTLVGLDTGLRSFHVFYDTNGTARLQKGNRIDHGEWWIDSQGRFCNRWQRQQRGESQCYRWEADDDRIIYYDNAGRLRAHAQMITGNPYEL